MNKKFMFQTRISVLLLCLIAITLTSACAKGSTKVIFTTGFGKDEVFRIENTICKKSEVMIYLTASQRQYEEVYGTDVWQIQKDGITLEESVKNTVLERLAQIKTMCLLAAEKGVELTEKEQDAAGKAAEEFLQGLTPEGRELLQADSETVELMFREYALSHKLYQYIIEDINPEISDDEARIITVQSLFLGPSHGGDEQPTDSYAEEELKEARTRAVEIREALADGADFLEMATKYGDNENITWSFGKGEAEPAVEQVAFLLETDEISPVIETKEGFYILKCVTTLNREETDINKTEIVEQRKREVFGVEYDRFVDTLARQINSGLWEEIEMVHDGSVPDGNFFEIYNRYFEEGN